MKIKHRERANGSRLLSPNKYQHKTHSYNFYSSVPLRRINLSPYTKHFHGERHSNQSSSIFECLTTLWYGPLQKQRTK